MLVVIGNDCIGSYKSNCHINKDLLCMSDINIRLKIKTQRVNPDKR